MSTETCIGVRKNDILIGNICPELKKIWLAGDSGIPRGDKNKFLEFEIPLPAINEQRKIAGLTEESALQMRKLIGAIESEIKLRNMYAKQCHARLMWGKDSARTFRLGQLCDRIQLGPYGKFLHKTDFTEIGVPVINPDDIQSGIISIGKHVSQTQARIISKWLVSNGDIVIARRGCIGRTAVADDASDGWLCGTGCMFMTPNDMVDSEYLAYSLSSPHAISRFGNHAFAGTMKTLNPDVLAQLPVYVPPLHEQKRTVQILKQIDQATSMFVAELSKEVSLRKA